MRNKILIVDDVDINREILRSILEDEYTILEAENGKQALEIVDQEAKNMAAILLDLVMPEMDGTQVLEELNRREVIGKVPVLVISGVKTLKLDIPLVPETRINWVFVPLHIAIIYILKLCLDEEIIPRCRFPCSRGYHKKYINWQKK